MVTRLAGLGLLGAGGNPLGAPAFDAVFGFLLASKMPAATDAALAHSVEDADVLHMNPVHSPTLPFAIMSGVFLWMSSLVAGWTAAPHEKALSKSSGSGH